MSPGFSKERFESPELGLLGLLGKISSSSSSSEKMSVSPAKLTKSDDVSAMSPAEVNDPFPPELGLLRLCREVSSSSSETVSVAPSEGTDSDGQSSVSPGFSQEGSEPELGLVRFGGEVSTESNDTGWSIVVVAVSVAMHPPVVFRSLLGRG